MIIGFCLFVMAVLMFFAVFLGGSLGATELLTEPTDLSEANNYVKYIIQSLGLSTNAQSFYFSDVEGALVWLTVIIVIAGVIGIQILGSGISESGHRITMICLIYGGAWAILSILTWSLIHSIPYYGSFLWLSLTIAYVIGVIKKISEG